MKLKLFLPLVALMAISSAFFSCSDDDNESANYETPVTNALMLEKFFLDDMAPTITRASAAEDFPEIKFLVYFQNNAKPKEDRFYDIGIALYDTNNKRIALYPLYDHVKARFDHVYKMDDKVIISKEIADGTYLLKPICKLSGEEEWEEMKLAEGLALTVNISGNQAQLEEVSDATGGIVEVRSISTDKASYSPDEAFKVTMRLFTTTNKASIPVFLAQANEDQEYKKLTGEIWMPKTKKVMWDANRTRESTITLSYDAPSTPSQQTYYILTPFSDEPIAQFDLITKGQCYEVSVNNIADEYELILDDNSIEGTLTEVNYDDIAFNQDVYAMLMWIDMTDFSINIDSKFERPECHQLIHFATPQRGTETGHFKFSNLDYDTYYAITYGIKDENGEFKDLNPDHIFILYTTPSDPTLSLESKMRKTNTAIIPSNIKYQNGKKVYVKE